MFDFIRFFYDNFNLDIQTLIPIKAHVIVALFLFHKAHPLTAWYQIKCSTGYFVLKFKDTE